MPIFYFSGQVTGSVKTFLSLLWMSSVQMFRQCLKGFDSCPITSNTIHTAVVHSVFCCELCF